MGKRLVLLTNSHPQVLKIKDEQTGVIGYLDAAISSHVFQVPKESPDFWKAVRKVEPFDPRRSLFVDDSPPVLRAARAAGIRWIRGVRRVSVSPLEQGRPSRDYGDIPVVESIIDLDPGHRALDPVVEPRLVVCRTDLETGRDVRTHGDTVPVDELAVAEIPHLHLNADIEDVVDEGLTVQ